MESDVSVVFEEECEENCSDLSVAGKFIYTTFTFTFMRKSCLKLFIVFQCGLFGSCHGLYMFFPEIVDKITTYSKQFPTGRATICEVLLKEDELMVNRTLHSIAHRKVQECSEKFEISTFGHSIVMEVLYMVGFFVITLIINRVSKLSIMTTILFGCGAFGIATHFVTLPIASIYIYVMFMLTFLTVNVVNAVTVDLFPTNLR